MKSKLNTDIIRLWTEPATVKSNNLLYPRVALGCGRSREQMILSNIGLIVSEVNRFLAFVPGFSHLRDDLISDAFVGLVRAVNKMASDGIVNDANPTSFMAMSIRGCFGKTVEGEQTIRIPSETRRQKKSKGIELEPPAREFSHYTEEEMEEAFTYDPRKMRDLRETLDACCESDVERKIIELRERKFVDREIAERLGLPLTTTYVMRRTLYARFLELTGWKGEP